MEKIKKGNLMRRMLFKALPLESYLRVLSKSYFVSYNSGVLKKNRLYAYPYFLEKIIKKDDVCIDIGANLGYISVVLSKQVGDKGKVYAVEPVKPMLAVLKKNTKGMKNVEILPYALGSENKPIKLGNDSVERDGFIASGSHFVLDKNTAQTETADVEFDAEMRIGTELFADLDRLDFIKCDIEGYEIIVLPQLEPVIMKFKPTVLVECDGENRIKLMQFFKERGFEALVLDGEGKLHPAKEDETWDILFVPEEQKVRVAEYLA
ncbi:MAG: FkbM family methyltransferase [Parvicella sp.]|jgi:FkbM family methyltransferase